VDLQVLGAQLSDKGQPSLQQRGIVDSVIKTLGIWKSLAYLKYVKIPNQQLASYSVLLC